MHRQHVDDVRPVLAVLVAVAHQLGGGRVTVGLVVDQNAAEGVAGEWVEPFEDRSEVGVVAHGRRLTK